MNNEASRPMSIDPVTLAVLQGRLEQVADEMDATLFRSAFNPIIAEAHDASHGIYHRDTGATLVQGTSGLPVFVGSMAGAVQLAIRRILRDAKRASDAHGNDSPMSAAADITSEALTLDDAVRLGTLLDGDVFVFNDPYEGGTHLNDMKMVRPFFRNGRVWCHLASVGHFTDVGGNVPGNYNPGATETPQEGVLIPPVKIRQVGALQQDIVDVICSISRAPFNAYGDLMGQLNALDLGAARLHTLLDEYGDAVVSEALDVLTDRAATLMRASIAQLPDGTYAAEDFLDNDGASDTPIKVVLALTIAGDRLTLDFTGTDDAVGGPINISRSTAVAACYVGLKHVFRDVPANFGCLEPVTLIIPEGSVLTACHPKPVGGYTETILRVMDLIFACIAQADPLKSNGASYGTINALSIAGRSSNRWVMFTFYGGGLGGSPVADGLNHGNAPLSTATIPPVEILESQYPVRFTNWSLRTDSGGPGKHRGGLGAEYEIELLDDEAVAFAYGDRARTSPPGVVGGGGAARNELSFVNHEGERLVPPFGAKVMGVQMKRGARVRIQSPGGGGYGDPSQRDVLSVARDVRLGYVTPEVARQVYRVALRADGSVDHSATSALRGDRESPNESRS
jgi:N-methylhydantoinase B